MDLCEYTSLLELSLTLSSVSDGSVLDALMSGQVKAISYQASLLLGIHCAELENIKKYKGVLRTSNI